eukprot:Gregarina_sp_Poly_1__4079@NODE_223_length_11242_cov_216_496107_g197_i0_p3_GENE_NODE_223_length_11242_cov_216_496107_g197_i0NODE_223_length_11242_cov_216_496107_g197_i0_p3_ORF_typecomplete_len535_score91_64_NODE_223_length_11242_cov_216_496107_g197_i023063910
METSLFLASQYPAIESFVLQLAFREKTTMQFRWVFLAAAQIADLQDTTIPETTTTLEDSAPVPAGGVVGRESWNVPWYRSNSPDAAVRRVIYHAASGQRLDVQSDEDGDTGDRRLWRKGFDFKDPIRMSRLVGTYSIWGDTKEGSQLTGRSGEGLEVVLQEQLATEVYCRGAKHKESLFGDAASRKRESQRIRDRECVRVCHLVAGYEEQHNASRAKLAASLTLRDCRIPITHLLHAPLAKVAVADGPRATIELPRDLWRHARIERRSDLVDFLVHFQLSICPPLDLATDSEMPSPIPLLVSPPNKVETVQTTTPVPTTEEETPETTETSETAVEPPALPVFSMMERYPQKRQPWSVDEFDDGTPYDFYPSDSKQGVSMWAAPAVHYASLAATSFNGATIAGYFQDSAIVRGFRSASGEGVADIGHTVRRMMEADRIEIALQSNCDIAEISPEIVFRRAVAWIYYVPADDVCAPRAKCAECVAAGCVWCRRRAGPTDFLDDEWRRVSGVSTWGRCGTPQDMCAYLGGESVSVSC